MDVHEIIKDIKGQFRLFMNGVVSQSMRRTMMWLRHCGKRTYANVKYWPACCSLWKPFIPKLQIFG